MQKGGAIGLLAYPTPANKLSYQSHNPTMGGLQTINPGGVGSISQPGNPLYQNMDPPKMSQVPSYLSKFVAGTARLEANPLGEPARTLRVLSPMSNSR